MSRWIPVEAFEHAGHGVFVSGEDGRIEFCNSEMAELLKLDRADIVGQRCCEIMRLRSPVGIQSDTRPGPQRDFRPALLSVKGGDRVEVDLLAIAVSPPVQRRFAILHLIKSSKNGRAVTATETSREREPDTYACLSSREREVMRHLAKGESTKEIADSLFVSIATVRNHVRAILSKLKVHSRIEAIMLPARRRRARSKTDAAPVSSAADHSSRHEAIRSMASRLDRRGRGAVKLNLGRRLAVVGAGDDDPKKKRDPRFREGLAKLHPGRVSGSSSVRAY